MKKTLGIAMLILGTLFSIPAASAAPINLRIADAASPDFHLNIALKEFKREVEEKTKGKFNVTIYPSGQIAGDTNMIEAAQTGIVEIAIEPPSFFAKWDSAFEVAELPYLFPNKDIAYKVLYSATGDKLTMRLANLGLKGIGWFDMGYRQVTNNKRAIRTPEDLKGIKLRTMKVPTHIEFFKQLTANPTPMNFSEVYAALQVGAIDGQENPLSHICTQRFYEVQKYLSLTNHVLGLYLPVINIDFWESLEPEDQKVILTAMKHANDFDRKLESEQENQCLKKIEQSGTKINILDEHAMSLMHGRRDELSNSYRERVGPQIYDAWMAAIKDVEKTSI